ncbi:hypothetical protein ACEWY4_017150 [Coilia grayii]|uniref:SCAN box domain-containing protein n=1 Tax=Coilia grayii TaxID=363190 RepID=A0ABD1JIY3_9TELE
MSEIDNFVATPTGEAFNSFTKDQLVLLADRFEVPLTSNDKRSKLAVKTLVREELVKREILSPAELCDFASVLTFEQQKELLLLQIDYSKYHLKEQEFLVEKCRLERELELGKQGVEKERLSLECVRLDLIGEGKIESGAKNVDITKNIRLLPKFDESDVDTFFNLFERVAGLYKWDDATRCLLLQCTLSGRAAQVYAALGAPENGTYSYVKKAVLKAYELVPEAYRQKFRGMRKQSSQTYVEFADELSTQLKRWCMATEVMSQEDLFNLILIEQFKNCLPEGIATYVSEHQVATVSEAAVLADDYALIHKTKFSHVPTVRNDRTYRGHQVPHTSKFDATLPVNTRSGRSQTTVDPTRICNYCLGVGHWKSECEKLKRKNDSRFKYRKPASDSAHPPALAVSMSDPPRQASENNFDCSFAPFVSTGFVSLSTNGKKVPIKILRDTGSVESFILQSVLPFSCESDSGQSVCVRGFDMNVVSVPLHKVHVSSGLVNEKCCWE